MRCPFCGSSHTRVLEKREIEDGKTVRRRRECLKCKRRFTTYERFEKANIMVVKKDGRREQFDKSKIINGLIKACEKRPVSMEDIQKIAEDVETQILLKNKSEINSKEIGEMIMRKLKKLDNVAYIRFASVYRAFADVGAFEKELKKMLEGGKYGRKNKKKRRKNSKIRKK